jgi:hypothetical protein
MDERLQCACNRSALILTYQILVFWVKKAFVLLNFKGYLIICVADL